MFGGARKETGKITQEESVEKRKERYADMVNHFYNLVTDFYEWGWGQSFHFAYQLKGESFKEAIARHEYFLAGRLVGSLCRRCKYYRFHRLMHRLLLLGYCIV